MASKGFRSYEPIPDIKLEAGDAARKPLKPLLAMSRCVPWPIIIISNIINAIQILNLATDLFEVFQLDSSLFDSTNYSIFLLHYLEVKTYLQKYC